MFEGLFLVFFAPKTPAKLGRQKRRAENANARPHHGRDEFMFETAFCRDALIKFFVGTPAHFPATADIIRFVVFDAAIRIIALGKIRAAVAFKVRRNCRRSFGNRIALGNRADRE